MISLTLSNWILVVALAILGILVSLTFAFYDSGIDFVRNLIIGILITIFTCVGVALLLNWFNTSTASGIRNYKDFKSELSNGINREITITAEDGREIFHYEGKIDIESNHTDNYIKFESEQGKRYIIYYGIQDTITIIEK